MDVWQNRFAKFQVRRSEAVQTQEDERRTAESEQNKEAEAELSRGKRELTVRYSTEWLLWGLNPF